MGVAVLMSLVSPAQAGWFGSDAGKAQAETPAKTPDHYYAYQDEARYGYESVLSPDDIKKGIKTKEMATARFVGARDGKYQILLTVGAATELLECSKPCEFFKASRLEGIRGYTRSFMRNEKGTVAWAAMQDAMNGKMTRAKLGQNKEFLWFNWQYGYLMK